MSNRELVIVHNAKSGSSLDLRTLRKLCREAGFTVKRMIPLDDTLSVKLRSYTSRATWIAAVGGDGTISAVANILTGTKAVLVPLPGGTLNHFTKDLGVDQDIAVALQEAARSKPTHIDIASVNGIYFINNSSIGVYPQSLRTRLRFQDRLGKWPAAAYGLLRAFVRYKTYDVEIDDTHLTTPFIFVGNNNYHLQDAAAGGRQSLTDSVLSVYIVNSSSRLNLIRIFSRALIGRLHSERDFTHFTSTAVTISSSSRRVRVSHDGEVTRMNFPLHYAIHPGKVTVVAPTKNH